jgi:hypothetical protein
MGLEWGFAARFLQAGSLPNPRIQFDGFFAFHTAPIFHGNYLCD